LEVAALTDTEALQRITELSHDGCLVWASWRPQLAGGGCAVKVIRPDGTEQSSRGETLGEAVEAVEELLERIGRLGVPA